MKSPPNINDLKLNDVIENLVSKDADSTFELIHAQWSEPLTYLMPPPEVVMRSAPV